MTITMLATLCHMATVNAAPIEFCQEQIVARREDGDNNDEAINACYVMAQQIIAPRLRKGYTVKQIRCASDKDDKDGKDRPRNAI